MTMGRTPEKTERRESAAASPPSYGTDWTPAAIAVRFFSSVAFGLLLDVLLLCVLGFDMLMHARWRLGVFLLPVMAGVAGLFFFHQTFALLQRCMKEIVDTWSSPG